MKIAVVGGGISGLTAAWYLDRMHDVTVFEKNGFSGGHTDTHHLHINGKTVAVDSGFIVFNKENYPCFSKLLEELDVESQPTEMSFSMVNEESGLEYGASGLQRLFAQKRNLLRPSFYRMMKDLLRFYKKSPALLETSDDSLTLIEYLNSEGYSRTFIDDHILPMASALWSGPTTTIEDFPARYFVAFMANHRMLQLSDRPQWRTVCGGSSQYVHQLVKRLNNPVITHAKIETIKRNQQNVTIRMHDGSERHFDQVVFACHSDQALALLDDPTPQEIQILGAIPYQKNTVTLHSDTTLLPENRAAWASWNARSNNAAEHTCQVSYWMNLLQNLECEIPVVVSLNASDQVDPAKTWLEREYSHPVYTPDSIRAQKRRNEINGKNRSWYCGAYWGWGFHEDGARSALDVVESIQSETHDAVA